MSEEGSGNNYQASAVVLEAMIREYEFESSRSAKLDSKITITMAFCGVLFLFIINYFNLKEIIGMTFDVNDVNYLWALYSGKSIVLIAQILTLVFYVISIYNLIKLLKTSQFFRYDPRFLIDHELYKDNRGLAEIFIATEYLRILSHNHGVNEGRSKEYNKALRFIKLTLASIAVVEFSKHMVF